MPKKGTTNTPGEVLSSAAGGSAGGSFAEDGDQAEALERARLARDWMCVSDTSREVSATITLDGNRKLAVAIHHHCLSYLSRILLPLPIVSDCATTATITTTTSTTTTTTTGYPNTTTTTTTTLLPPLFIHDRRRRNAKGDAVRFRRFDHGRGAAEKAQRAPPPGPKSRRNVPLCQRIAG